MKPYYFLGRLLSPFGVVGLYAYSYLTRTARTRLVVENEKGEVLLVQTWLGGDKWGLPGGGADRGETLEVAASRELREETGIIARAEALQPLFTLRSAGHEEAVFSLTVLAASLPERLPNRFEIKEAAWFPLSDLPRLESLAERILNKVATNR